MYCHGPANHLLTCRNQQPHTLVFVKIEGVAEEDGLQAHSVSTVLGRAAIYCPADASNTYFLDVMRIQDF